jgi:hypothetical protein
VQNIFGISAKGQGKCNAQQGCCTACRNVSCWMQGFRAEPLEVTYSFFDGSGHRRVIMVLRGDSIGDFLKKVRDELSPEFKDLRSNSLMLSPPGDVGLGLIFIWVSIWLPAPYLACCLAGQPLSGGPRVASFFVRAFGAGCSRVSTCCAETSQ